MAAGIVAKTAPTGKTVGSTTALTTLFTYTDSVASVYNYKITPADAASISGETVTHLKVGNVTIEATLIADATVKASITIKVAEARKNQIVDVTTHHDAAAYQVTVITSAVGGYDGKWQIEVSADGITYFVPDGWGDIATSKYIPVDASIPYLRVTATAGTVGTIAVGVFGPGVSTIKRSFS